MARKTLKPEKALYRTTDAIFTRIIEKKSLKILMTPLGKVNAGYTGLGGRGILETISTMSPNHALHSGLNYPADIPDIACNTK